MELLHRVLERGALRHLVGQVDGDELGIAVRHEAMAAPLERPPAVPVIGQLAVVHHGDIGERVCPVRDGPSGYRHRTPSPCGYGRSHACRRTRAMEYCFETRAASPRSLMSSRPWPIERISAPSTSSMKSARRRRSPSNVMRIAQRIFGRLVDLEDLRAELLEPALHFLPALTAPACGCRSPSAFHPARRLSNGQSAPCRAACRTAHSRSSPVPGA